MCAEYIYGIYKNWVFSKFLILDIRSMDNVPLTWPFQPLNFQPGKFIPVTSIIADMVDGGHLTLIHCCNGIPHFRSNILWNGFWLLLSFVVNSITFLKYMLTKWSSKLGFKFSKPRASSHKILKCCFEIQNSETFSSQAYAL